MDFSEDEHHEAIRFMHRQRLQHQGIDQREDGKVGADAEGEREQGDRTDDGCLPELADGETQVTAERRQQSHGGFDAPILTEVGTFCQPGVSPVLPVSSDA